MNYLVIGYKKKENKKVKERLSELNKSLDSAEKARVKAVSDLEKAEKDLPKVKELYSKACIAEQSVIADRKLSTEEKSEALKKAREVKDKAFKKIASQKEAIKSGSGKINEFHKKCRTLEGSIASAKVSLFDQEIELIGATGNRLEAKELFSKASNDGDSKYSLVKVVVDKTWLQAVPQDVEQVKANQEKARIERENKKKAEQKAKLEEENKALEEKLKKNKAAIKGLK